MSLSSWLVAGIVPGIERQPLKKLEADKHALLKLSRFFPLCSWNSDVEKAHGRIEWRAIDVLPAEAVGIQGEWPTVRQICRVIRSRQVKKNGEWQKPQHEVVYLVSSLPAATSPQALLGVNRDHWRIEIMHRNKDVILGEDGYTNRCDNAPRNIFSLTGFVLKI